MKQSYKKRNNNIYRIILKVTLVLSISSIVAKDIEIIPLDWVNHYGLESKQGIAMWSQDWESGPLLCDGTVAHFPRRFGQWSR